MTDRPFEAPKGGSYTVDPSTGQRERVAFTDPAPAPSHAPTSDEPPTTGDTGEAPAAPAPSQAPAFDEPPTTGDTGKAPVAPEAPVTKKGK